MPAAFYLHAMQKPSPGIGEAFGAHAPDYDRLRRRLVPNFDAFYGAALEIVAEWQAARGDKPLRVLDLGAGTGLFAAMVRERFPKARIHLVDLSAPMLAEAERRFAKAKAGRAGTAVAAADERPGRVTFAVADYAKDELGGPWDLVISALSIHHIDDAAKRTLFARIFAALAPGGLFLEADQVLAPTPELAARDHAHWRATAAGLGASEAEIVAAEGRMSFDRCATLEDQLAWLREAGFAPVDCGYKARQFAVFFGVKPAR